MIEKVLAFTRLQVGGLEAELAPIELRDLIDEIRAVIEPLASQKNISFVVTTPETPDTFISDPAKPRQILLNLIGNVKFTDQGSVRIDVLGQQDALAFGVTDTGIGIPPHLLDRVFEPFWQGDQSRTRQWGGTGLGLAISNRLAALIGGEISVESQPGEGTRFTLQLQVGKAVATVG